MPASAAPLKRSSKSAVKSKAGMSHESQLANLVRIEGQVRGVARMILEKRYCPEILTQIKAISAALRSVEINIVDHHLKGCVAQAIASGNSKSAEEALEEVTQLLKSSTR